MSKITSSNGAVVTQTYSSNKNKKAMTIDRSSASTASNDSSSDPLESDFSEGSCEDEDLKGKTRTKSGGKRTYTLDDFQIIKTIGKSDTNIHFNWF